MKKKFTIETEMEERWIPHFMSMLKRMQHLGEIGSSRNVAIYSDGDGDFRPRFTTNVEYERKEPASNVGGHTTYDAG